MCLVPFRASVDNERTANSRERAVFPLQRFAGSPLLQQCRDCVGPSAVRVKSIVSQPHQNQAIVSNQHDLGSQHGAFILGWRPVAICSGPQQKSVRKGRSLIDHLGAVGEGMVYC